MPSDKKDPPTDVKSRLKDLEAVLYGSGHIQEQVSTLEEMIRLVEANRDHLDETEDRIRILRFRIAMLQYNREVKEGSSGKSHFLRHAAAQSRPHPCKETSCPDGAPQCLQNRAGFSPRQQKMCEERLNALSNALKFEAAGEASRFNYAGALGLRRAARDLQGLLLRIAPSEGRRLHYDYLDYWCLITEGMAALERGRFPEARRASEKALTAARRLSDGRCFPNYFRDLKDVRRYPIYIDALDWVSRGQFLDAQREFQAWLDERPEEPYDLRSHTAPLLVRLCGLLHASRGGQTKTVHWDELEVALRSAYTGPIILALWRRAKVLRDAEPQQVGILLQDVAENWRLFNQDTRLTSDDRGDSSSRRAALPRFLDVAVKVRPEQAWAEILHQTLRHAFLLLAEHECLQRRVLDALDLLELPTAQILDHLVAWAPRGSPKADALRRSTEWLAAFENAAAQGSFGPALSAWQATLDPLRFFPHVVRVEASYVQKPSLEPDSWFWETTLERCWDHASRRLILEGPEPLQPDAYYYMDSAWNVDHKPRARVRHEERFHLSMLAGPMDIFAEGLFGTGPFDPKAFHDWVLQFDPEERLLACRLAGLLQVLDHQAMQGLWRRVIDQIPDAKEQRAAFIGLGAHMGKSGPHQVYPFQQALKEVPGAPRRSALAFPTLDALDPQRLPPAIVFLDDFVGSGDQASRTFVNLLAKRPWLRETRLHFGAAVGFADGAKALRGACRELDSIVLGKELTEADRAFSPQNPAWASGSQREAAKRFAMEAGEAVVGRDMALGYQNSQAMIAFPHNVPNNTLPLFWATPSPLLRRA